METPASLRPLKAGCNQPNYTRQLHPPLGLCQGQLDVVSPTRVHQSGAHTTLLLVVVKTAHTKYRVFQPTFITPLCRAASSPEISTGWKRNPSPAARHHRTSTDSRLSTTFLRRLAQAEARFLVHSLLMVISENPSIPMLCVNLPHHRIRRAGETKKRAKRRLRRTLVSTKQHNLLYYPLASPNLNR